MWRASRSRNRVDADENVDGIVVIPPLGDANVENEVRQLFDRHGIRTQDAEGVDFPSSRSYSAYDYEAEALHDATVDDAHALQRDPESTNELMEVDELESDCISSHTPSRSSSPSPSTHIPMQVSPSPVRVAQRYRHGLRQRAVLRNPKDDLDLAGMCFDPSGRFIYVGSTDGVAEWSVKGAEKQWWCDSEWA